MNTISNNTEREDSSAKASSNIMRYLINNFLIVLSTALNLLANRLIFNIILLFHFRNTMKTIFRMALSFQLQILEFGVLFNYVLYRLICALSGTKIDIEKSGEEFNSSGMLRYRVLHKEYWNDGKPKYGEDKNATSALPGMLPVSEFLDITRSNERSLENLSSEDVEVSSPPSEVKANMSTSTSTNNSIVLDEENEREGSVVEDINVHSRYLFPFQRKSRKASNEEELGPFEPKDQNDSNILEENKEQQSPRKKLSKISSSIFKLERPHDA